MTISEEAVTKICEVLGITRDLELDDVLILANAIVEQTKIKSKLSGPAQLIFPALVNRTRRRFKEGYVPPEVVERIEAAVLG